MRTNARNDTRMKTFKSKEDEVLNYFVNHSTNAAAQSLNSKMEGFGSELRGGGERDLLFYLFRSSGSLVGSPSSTDNIDRAVRDEWICFVDADNYLPEKGLQILVEHVERSGADIINANEHE